MLLAPVHLQLLLLLGELIDLNCGLQERIIKKSVLTTSRTNRTKITIHYVAGIEHPPGIHLNMYLRSGRYLSGALLSAMRKINKLAETGSDSSPLPHNYEMELRFDETYGKIYRSIGAVADICVARKAWAIIGPQETCRTEADIATAYNVFMISHYCTDNILTENPERHSTFVITRPQLSGLADALLNFLRQFNWTNVAVIASKDKEQEFLMQSCIDTLKKNNIRILHTKTFESPIIFLYEDHFAPIVSQTYMTCRIYVFIGFDFEMVGFLWSLYKRGLTDTGDYFVVAVMLRHQVISKTFLENIKERQLNLKSMMRNFVIISPIIPERELVKNLEKEFKDLMSLPPFNVTLNKNNRIYVPIEASYLFDAVWLYATAVGKILRNSSLGSPRNGTLIKSLLINHEYQSIFGYINRINIRGIASGNYTVKQLIFNDSGFEIVSVGISRTSPKNPNILNFEFIHSKTMDWVKGVPLDRPKCDFNGSLCRSDNRLTAIICGSIIITVFIIVIQVAFKIRSNMFEKELERLLWKIDKNKDIDITNPMLYDKFSFIWRPKICVAENETLYIPVIEDTTTFLRGNSVIDVSLAVKQNWTDYDLMFGMYKSQEVAIKRIYFSTPLSITREVKKELKILKETTFTNLDKFHGALIEHQGTWVVWEFCDRGSLQDVLYCTNLTQEYPVFLSSFAFDVIRGLMFLHENPEINFHGNLKSSNCVVDSRWTVKLRNFGMTEFLSFKKPSPKATSHEYFLSLFWTAPEILRHILQYKYHQNHFLIDLRQQLSEENRSLHETHCGEDCSFFSNKHSKLDRLASISTDSFPTPNNLDIGSYQKGDIFSFGILFHELHCCQIPYFSHYKTQNSAREIIRRLIVLNDEFQVPYRPKLSLICRTDGKVTDLVKGCWQEQMCQRPNVKTVYNRLKNIYGDKRNLVECMKEKMTLYTKNLEKEVMKRTEELREEKKQNEELLYQMLPIMVAEQLRQHKQVEAEAFDCVTIYFSDIVGFTELASSCTPFEVVNLLNQLYTSFDRIIDNYNVYKVETIGDSYMVVSGLPIVFDKHAREMANMSLRLLEEITKGFIIPSKNHQNESLKLRIGLHSGPCCAGVVGTRNPRYCLFGDTVNMASRMESTGEACQIHCSSAFISEIELLNEFQIVPRGSVDVKGKGLVETFWLVGKIANVNQISGHKDAPTNDQIKKGVPSSVRKVSNNEFENKV